MRDALAAACALLLAACGSHAATHEVTPEQGAQAGQGDVVTPPFAVRGDLHGLLLVWYDAQGPHIAQKRDDIPDAHRDMVRIASLRAAAEDEEDDEHVLVADVRQAQPDGSYAVRRVTRDALESHVLALAPPPPPVQDTQVVAQGPGDVEPPPGGAPSGGTDVVIYGASWCGACRAAQSYLRQRGVPFVEKDIEREPGAQQEMLAKAARAGLRPSGIPVIDFRGHILLGFDQRAIDQLIAQTSPPAHPSDGVGTQI